MDSWQELANPRDLTKIVTKTSNTHRGTRCEKVRILATWPDDATFSLPFALWCENKPCDEFDFEEDADGADHSKYVWTMPPMQWV